MSLEGKVESKVTLKGSIISNTQVMEALNELNTQMTEALKEVENNAVRGEESKEHSGCYFRTVAGVTEWINPPSILGEEYRTTERWNGKVVYTKLFDFGELPNKSMKQIAHGAAATNIVRYAATRSNGEAIPMWYDTHTILIDVSVSSIVITTSFDASARTAVVQIWYTKD